MGIYKNIKKTAGELRGTDLLFGLLFSFMFIIGRSICENHDFSKITESPLASILMFFMLGAFFLLVLKLLEYILSWLVTNNRIESKIEPLFEKKYVYVLMWVLLWVVYMICYLSYYPGIFRYDVVSQTNQGLGLEKLSNFQPIIHTFVWKIFLEIEGVLGIKNVALILYSIVQLTLVTLLSVCIVRNICVKLKLPQIAIIAYVYYLIVPTLHIFSIIMTKDVYFTCFTALFLIEVYDVDEQSGLGDYLKCVIWGLLATLFRNNMVYAIMIVAVITIFIKSKRKLMLAMAGIVAASKIITAFIYPLCGIGDTAPHEALSVPISQVAYVYMNDYDCLSEEEKNNVEIYIRDPHMVNPRIADFVKSSFNDVWYKVDSGSFWKTYFSIFKKKPLDYACVFLDLNVNLWYVNAPFPDPYSNREYIETGIADSKNYVVEQNSIFPKLNHTYENFAGFKSKYMNLPVLQGYFALSFPIMSLLFSAYCFFKKAKKHHNHNNMNVVVIMLVLFALFASYLLGPVGIYRYMYTFYFLVPWYMAICVKAAK